MSPLAKVRLKIIERAQHFEGLRNEYIKLMDCSRAADMDERSKGLRDAAEILAKEIEGHECKQETE